MRSKNDLVIVGLGNIGLLYDLKSNYHTTLTHSKGFANTETINIVAGVDPDPEKRRIFEENYNVKSYCSIEDTKGLFDPKLVVISTPTKSHLKSLMTVISTWDPSIILCEKPLSFSLSESKKIVDICKKNNIKLFVNYPRISDPIVNQIRNQILNSNYQTPAEGTVWYSKSLYNSGIHFVNIMSYFFGAFKEILIIDKDDSSQNSYDIKPSFKIKFDKANITFLSLRMQELFINEFKLIFSNGVLNYRNAGSAIEWFEANKNEFLFSNEVLIKTPIQLNSNFRLLQQNVCYEIEKYLLEGKANLCDAKLSIETEKLLELITFKNYNHD